MLDLAAIAQNLSPIEQKLPPLTQNLERSAHGRTPIVRDRPLHVPAQSRFRMTPHLYNGKSGPLRKSQSSRQHRLATRSCAECRQSGTCGRHANVRRDAEDRFAAMRFRRQLQLYNDCDLCEAPSSKRSSLPNRETPVPHEASIVPLKGILCHRGDCLGRRSEYSYRRGERLCRLLNICRGEVNQNTRRR